MNTFGHIFRLTTFGESHGPAIGGIIDGVPAGYEIDFDSIEKEMARRRPGQSFLTTQRKENDIPVFLSGIFNGRTLGTPIAFTIANSDIRSDDYAPLEHVYRPGHADYTYDAKYGIRDYRGGGRASARETAVRIVGGAIARQILKTEGISVSAYPLKVGRAEACMDDFETKMKEEIQRAFSEHDSIGGIVGCSIKGVTAGLGEPVYGKLQSMLASAMMSINAAKGFDYGSGFECAGLRGSELMDRPHTNRNGKWKTDCNHSGGILGGISTGEEIYFRVAFKPIATLPSRPIETIDKNGNAVILKVKGRHDPCVIPRVIPIVEAMAAMTILDAFLLNRCSRLK